MVKELIEIVFERLDGAVALKLATKLSPESELPDSDQGLWETRVSNLVIGEGCFIDNAHVRILCYEVSVYDVELNFVLEDTNLKPKRLLHSILHRFALELADEHGVHNCYAGLEPAVDKETRLFTNEMTGPLFLEGIES